MVNRCSEKSILKELIPLGIVLKEEAIGNYYLKLQQNTIITIHQRVFKFGESLCYDESFGRKSLGG
jgi:hypothetical protein